MFSGERWETIFNFALGMLIFIPLKYLSYLIHSAQLPRALSLLEYLPYFPYVLFYRWSKPEMRPWWVDILTLTVAGCVLYGIARMLSYFGVDRSAITVILVALSLFALYSPPGWWQRFKSPEA